MTKKPLRDFAPVVQLGEKIQQYLRFRQPYSGLTHLLGVVLACIGTILLLWLARGDAHRELAFGIYGGSLIVLYLASTLYHSVPVEGVWLDRLRRFDHAAIYLLIAGTYTPVCLIKFNHGIGGWFLLAAWSIAAFGVLSQICWRGMPVWLNVVLYFVMGWMSMLCLGALLQALGTVGLTWLFIGGVIYTAGGIIFAVERPRLWPEYFGFHELWHLFVLAGSLAHFALMLTLI